jgi:ABC-type transport system involved in cytochrome bd biosynthesis fused ATPase/permease subunit
MGHAADDRAERWKSRAVAWMKGQREWRFLGERAQIRMAEAEAATQEWRRVARMWKRRCRRMERLLEIEDNR